MYSSNALPASESGIERCIAPTELQNLKFGYLDRAAVCY